MAEHFDTAAEAIARLEQLREERAEIERADAAKLAELKEAVRAAGEVTVNGHPLNRTLIIQASGLARGTVYKILERLPGRGS